MKFTKIINHILLFSFCFAAEAFFSNPFSDFPKIYWALLDLKSRESVLYLGIFFVILGCYSSRIYSKKSIIIPTQLKISPLKLITRFSFTTFLSAIFGVLFSLVFSAIICFKNDPNASACFLSLFFVILVLSSCFIFGIFVNSIFSERAAVLFGILVFIFYNSIFNFLSVSNFITKTSYKFLSPVWFNFFPPIGFKTSESVQLVRIFLCLLVIILFLAIFVNIKSKTKNGTIVFPVFLVIIFTCVIVVIKQPLLIAKDEKFEYQCVPVNSTKLCLPSNYSYLSPELAKTISDFEEISVGTDDPFYYTLELPNYIEESALQNNKKRVILGNVSKTKHEYFKYIIEEEVTGTLSGYYACEKYSPGMLAAIDRKEKLLNRQNIKYSTQEIKTFTNCEN